MGIIYRAGGYPNNNGLRINGKSTTFNGIPILGSTFDLDGTLVNRELMYFAAHVEVARQAGLAVDPKDFNETSKSLPHFFGGPNDAIMREIKELTHISMSVEEMLELDKQLFRDLVMGLESIEPREGARELILALKAAGLPVAIGTVTDEEDALATLRKLGMYDLFDHIVLRRDVTHAKPDPEVYFKTSGLMHVEAHQHLIFEDSPTGSKAAVDSGAHVIALPVEENPKMIERLKEIGVHQIALDWNDLNEALFREDNENNELRGDGTLGFRPPGDGPGFAK